MIVNETNAIRYPGHCACGQFSGKATWESRGIVHSPAACGDVDEHYELKRTDCNYAKHCDCKLALDEVAQAMKALLPLAEAQAESDSLPSGKAALKAAYRALLRAGRL